LSRATTDADYANRRNFVSAATRQKNNFSKSMKPAFRWLGPLAAALFRSVAQLVIVVRQFEHHGPGALVAHFIRQHAHLGGATTPMFWIVDEADGTGHSTGPMPHISTGSSDLY
jgi:hypothetical protein